MVEFEQLVFGALIAALALVALWRMSGTIKALIALWRRPQATETGISTEETISVEGATFVEESAMATDRLFGDDPRDIGSYVWRATFIRGGKLHVRLRPW
jgi:hypothetical protein